MRIDQSHRSWALWALAIFVVALVAYVPYAITTKPTGGTIPGMLYGIAGYGMMLFAALLGARKKLTGLAAGACPLLDARPHLVLSAVPAVDPVPLRIQLPRSARRVAHGAAVPGISQWHRRRAFIQHFVPGLILSTVPLETIYEEIPHRA